MGGFSGWASSAQPFLSQVRPHTVARKDCPPWKRLSGSLAGTCSPAPGAGLGGVCHASFPHVLLGLRPSSPVSPPQQSQDLCTCSPPSSNTCFASCIPPSALRPPQFSLSSRTVNFSAVCGPALPPESCRWRETLKYHVENQMGQMNVSIRFPGLLSASSPDWAASDQRCLLPHSSEGQKPQVTASARRVQARVPSAGSGGPLSRVRSRVGGSGCPRLVAQAPVSASVLTRLSASLLLPLLIVPLYKDTRHWVWGPG